MNKITSFLILLAVGISLKAQTKIPKFSAPTKVEAINSAAEESAPIPNKNGDHLFFIKSFYGKVLFDKDIGQEVWESAFVDDSWQMPTSELDAINDNGNNAVIGISASGDKLYVFNSIQTRRKLAKGIASIRKDTSGNWGKLTHEKVPNLTIGEGVYSFYITPDEQYLIFSQPIDSLSKPGLYREDLFVSIRQEDGKWGEIINLGKTINTTSNELSPFLGADGKTLFFASNGHQGLGDYDLFVAHRLDDSWTNWSVPANLGSPVNSSSFDAYLSMDNNNTAYFVSNRNQDNSDIYTTKLLSDLAINLIADVKEEIAPTPDVEVTKEIKQVEDAINENKEVLIKEIVSTPVPTVSTDKPIKETTALIEVDQNNKVIIPFELNATELTAAAKKKINLVIGQLENSKRIMITGHTDTSGNDAVNQRISDGRAEAVKQYLLKKGLEKQYLTAKGVADREPIATNETREGRSLNRMVEILF